MENKERVINMAPKQMHLYYKILNNIYACSYHWTCKQLHDRKAPCFREGYNLDASAGVVQIPGHEFLAPVKAGSDHIEFLFELTVSFPGRGEAKTDQILRMKSTQALK